MHVIVRIYARHIALPLKMYRTWFRFCDKKLDWSKHRQVVLVIETFSRNFKAREGVEGMMVMIMMKISVKTGLPEASAQTHENCKY